MGCRIRDRTSLTMIEGVLDGRGRKAWSHLLENVELGRDWPMLYAVPLACGGGVRNMLSIRRVTQVHKVALTARGIALPSSSL